MSHKPRSAAPRPRRAEEGTDEPDFASTPQKSLTILSSNSNVGSRNTIADRFTGTDTFSGIDETDSCVQRRFTAELPVQDYWNQIVSGKSVAFGQPSTHWAHDSNALYYHCGMGAHDLGRGAPHFPSHDQTSLPVTTGSSKQIDSGVGLSYQSQASESLALNLQRLRLKNQTVESLSQVEATSVGYESLPASSCLSPLTKQAPPQKTTFVNEISKNPPEPSPFPDQFVQDEDGDTLLHLMIIMLQQMYVLTIIARAPSVSFLDTLNDLRQTPLHLAVITNQADIVRALLAHGARLTMRDRHGNTPLHVACQKGFVECVLALMKSLEQNEIAGLRLTGQPQQIPQDVSITNYDGETCMHLAYTAKNYSIIQFMVSEFNVDINVRDAKFGRTLLHRAVQDCNLDFVRYLLRETQCRLDLVTFNEWSARRLAAAAAQQEPNNRTAQLVYNAIVKADGSQEFRPDASSSDEDEEDGDEEKDEDEEDEEELRSMQPEDDLEDVDLYDDLVIDGQPISLKST